MFPRNSNHVENATPPNPPPLALPPPLAPALAGDAAANMFQFTRDDVVDELMRRFLTGTQRMVLHDDCDAGSVALPALDEAALRRLRGMR